MYVSERLVQSLSSDSAKTELYRSEEPVEIRNGLVACPSVPWKSVNGPENRQSPRLNSGEIGTVFYHPNYRTLPNYQFMQLSGEYSQPIWRHF